MTEPLQPLPRPLPPALGRLIERSVAAGVMGGADSSLLTEHHVALARESLTIVAELGRLAVGSGTSKYLVVALALSPFLNEIEAALKQAQEAQRRP